MPRLTTPAERLLFPAPHLWLPTPRFSRRRCCCGATYPCYRGCSGERAPENLLVRVPAAANNGCNNCAATEGSYVIPWYVTGLPQRCDWADSFGDPCDANDSFQVRVVMEVPTTYLYTYGIDYTLGADEWAAIGTAKFLYSTKAEVFLKIYNAIPNCVAFDEEELPYYGHDCRQAAMQCVFAPGQSLFVTAL